MVCFSLLCALFLENKLIVRFLRFCVFLHIFAYKKDTVSRVLELMVFSFLFQLKCTCVELIILALLGNKRLVIAALDDVSVL